MPKGVYVRTKPVWNKGKIGCWSEAALEKMRVAHIGLAVGEKSGKWKGGTYRNGAGYILEQAPTHPNRDGRGYVYQHRLIVEKIIGRFLTTNEHCHHINGIKNDNRIENLMVFKGDKGHKGWGTIGVDKDDIVFDGRKWEEVV
jgi:hypothetical protein